jgi:hypothetical protein
MNIVLGLLNLTALIHLGLGTSSLGLIRIFSQRKHHRLLPSHRLPLSPRRILLPNDSKDFLCVLNENHAVEENCWP